jgi:outer membrane protein assembly factor BamB
MNGQPSRRHFLASLGTALTVGTAGCTSVLEGDSTEATIEAGSCAPYNPRETSQTTWPTRHGGSDGTGAVAADAVPGGALTVDWAVPIDTHVGYHVPIAGNDTVYVHDMDTTLFALEAETGDERWRISVESPGPAPTLGDNRLLVATERGLEAFEAETGDHVWTVDGLSAGIFDSPPVVVGETGYLFGDVSVWALDLTDGSVRWRIPIGLPSESSPAVVEDTLYVAGNDTYLRALSTEDGSERWRQKTAARIECNVAVAGQTVYTGSESGVVLACDTTDGTEHWRYRLPTRTKEQQRTPHTIATDGARVYVTTGDVLYALDSTTGTPCWAVEGYKSRYSSGIAVGDGMVFVPVSDRASGSETTTGGTVFDAVTGTQLRTFATEIERDFRGGPSIANGALYTNGRDALRRFS